MPYVLFKYMNSADFFLTFNILLYGHSRFGAIQLRVDPTTALAERRLANVENAGGPTTKHSENRSKSIPLYF